MATVNFSNNTLVLSSSSEACVVTVEGGSCTKRTLSIPQYVENQKKPCDSEPGKTIIKLSKSNKYLAICSSKRLSIWSTENYDLISSRDINRTASSLIFTPKETRIVLADKGGDVYTFDLLNSDPGMLILGHLSIILDLLISDDEKYIITCDRDEKIRVSNYPNSYNIHSYCLGHKEFVSCLKFTPENNILISGSGDATIKFWKFADGLELYTFSLSQLPVDISLPNNAAVSNLDVMKINDTLSLICFSIYSIHKLIVLLLKHNNYDLSCTFHSTINLSSEIVNFCISGNHLVVLSGEKEGEMSYFVWAEEGFVKDKDRFLVSEELKKYWDVSNIKDSMEFLYKKRYDNVQEYLEKKKARIEASQ